MNDFVPNPNSGSLFTVTENRNPNWPDIRGEIFVSRDLLDTVMKQDGDLVKISISAWRKESKSGKKYLSLSVSEPYEKKPGPKADPVDDDDIPF